MKEMKSLKKAVILSMCLMILALAGCQNQNHKTENEELALTEKENDISNTEIDEKEREEKEKKEKETMKIQIETNGNKIVVDLNNSQAAKDLYAQLPLIVENEDFADNEKTFYPLEKLDVTDAPHTDGNVGTLAYYEPWGDVVIFYGEYQPNDALYELGKVSSGSEYMKEISGKMTVSVIEE